MKKNLTKRLVSLLLCATMLLGLFPASFVSAAAGDSGTISTVNGAAGSKLVDPSNLHGWKEFFGADFLNTQNAGGVWADKSVFLSAADFKEKMNKGESITGNAAYQNLSVDADNFLVSLSAIAATKEITGYSAIPTDTVFVLDLSQSMDRGQYVPTMVAAANDAIDTLLSLNLHNRISVVLYSGRSTTGSSNLSHATVLLPLDRYTKTGNGYVYCGGSASETTVSVAPGVRNAKGQQVTGSKTTQGGTYIQSGLYLAYGEFEKAYKNGTTVIESDLIQGGTKRMPVIALMSDGQPTAATDQYSTFTRSSNSVGGVTNYGDGTANTNTITFLTQLTAKWVKESVSDWYENDALFYTLYLKGANDSSENPTLKPSSSGTTLDTWWKSYLNAADGANVSFRVSQNSSFSIVRDSVVDQVPAVNPATEAYNLDWQAAQNYVNKAFNATNATAFRNAFKDIVQTIIAQSRYYPTMIQGKDNTSSGYITIEDPIGAFMEVKEIEGIDIGGHLFTGEALVQMMLDNEFGSRDEYTENGRLLIEAIMERVGVTEPVAIALAEEAWAHGQLGYDAVTRKYSNYIGWYADKDNRYVGFWHDGHTIADVPAGATQIMKSYGFYGVIDESISDSNIQGTDMMHVAVRVAVDLATGQQEVTLGIPAALIPLVLYEVTVNANRIDAATEASMKVTGATHPIRLLFEVGLRDDINELTVDSIVSGTDHYHTDVNGNFVFYTNRWGDNHGVEGGTLVHPDPTAHTASISHYNPSTMNERYYYNQDSAIYTDTNGTRYTGNTAPTGDGYYHLEYIFRATQNGGPAEIVKNYRRITVQSIAHAEKNADANTWYIPGGTMRYDITAYEFPKTENTTGTLGFIVDTDIPGYSEGKYEVYELHGNNGRLVLGQTTGIELTKKIAVVVPGTETEDFVLNVAFAAPAGTVLPETVKVSYDRRTYVEMDIDDVSVTLDANQSAWIFGLPAGVTYTVTEENHEDYEPAAPTVSGTVVDGKITPVEFRNVAKELGRVVITKKVEHPFENKQFPANTTFDFIATLTDENGNPVASADVSTSAGIQTTSAQGQFSFRLADGQSLAINALPDGTNVSVEEVNLPGYFTVSQAVQSVKSEYNTVKEMTFTNTYTPAAVYGSDVKISGTKLLDGREWQDFDAYRFSLQYWNGVSWQTLAGGQDAEATKADPTFNLSDVIAGFVFDREGSYRFWIVEEEGDLGGVRYDSSVREFVVNVEDDWSGAYRITSVEASTNRVRVSSTTLNGTTEYTVETDFTNVYEAKSTFTDLSGTKTLSGDKLESYVGENGFAFELYSASLKGGTVSEDALVYTAHLDEEGKLSFDHNYIGHLLFDRVGTYYFIIREAQNGRDPLMVFDETYYEVKVTVTDNLVGGLVAETEVIRVSGNTRTAVQADEIDFANTRLPDPVFAVIPGLKAYNLALTDGMFTFDLYRASLSGNTYTPEGSALLSAQNAADGSFTLKDSASSEILKFTEAGDYHFAVTERLPSGVTAAAPTANGITYDTTVYGITVRVTESVVNGRSTLSYTLLVNGTAGGSVSFENRYDASAAGDLVLQGEKTLDGKTSGTEVFSFELCEARVNGNDVTVGAQLDVASPVNGTFTFKPLSYTSLSDVGTYYYVIREVIPAAVDTNLTLKGITYDASEYLVKVVVSDNGDGTLSVVHTVTKNGASAEIAFANTYSITASSDVVIGGEKIAKHFTLKDGDFSFDLYHATVNGNDVTLGSKIESKTNANGAFSFTPITYDSLSDVGTHYYVVKESLPIAAGAGGVAEGISYDRSEFLVKVVVSDNGDGTLSVVRTVTKNGVAAEIRFENEYGITTPGAITVSGEKTLTDKTLADGVYTFELYKATVDAQGKVETVGAALDTKKNLDGKFTFDAITFDSLSDVGVHYFAVKESVPAAATSDGVLAGVKYDTRLYLVAVTVTDNGDGTLGVTSKTTLDGADATIRFENKYGVMTPATVTLEGEKTLDGKAPKDGEFKFALYSASKRGNQLEIGTNALEEVSTVDGKFAFTSLTFDELNEAGTYYFAIRELIPAGVDSDYVLNGVKYDPAVFYAQVTVTDKGDGTFGVDVQYSTETEAAEKPVFANKTVKEEAPPQTSDRTDLALWYALLFVSGTALFAIPLIARKKREH
ncbi:MAG: VWA domain-containing protein [Clostridia bacterium]|nr:VWA domain-containing protein [Clostridia bacterium]